MSAKLKQMREQVLKELEHIPESSIPMRELRSAYWMSRMHSLGKKATSSQTANEVLQGCIKLLQKDYPDFKFEYDKELFIQN